MYSSLCIAIVLCLHFMAFAFIVPDVAPSIELQTILRVILIAGAVAVAVQLIKRASGRFVDGRGTLIFNVLFSFMGAAAFGGGKLVSLTTLAEAGAIIVIACGVHGLGRGLFPLNTDPLSTGKEDWRIAPVVVLLLVVGLAGCAMRGATAAPPPPLPAGAADQVDANANRVLQDIYAFMWPITRDIKNGKLQATAGQRAAIDKLDGLYNQARIAEQTYHSCMYIQAAATTGGPVTVSAVCLANSGLTGALANAQGAFTTALSTVIPSPAH